MDDGGQWRDRYLKIAEQLEAEERRFQEAERELLRLLSRLCVATAGLDSMLDPHLERLRKAVREGANGKLIAQAQRLGDALLKAQDERVNGDLLARVLDRSCLPSAQVKSATRIWRQLAGAPDKSTDRQLDELAAVLFPGSQTEPGSGKKGGLIGRLLQRTETSSPNELLQQVLHSISWPDGMQAPVDDLQAQLASDKPDDAWVEVVRQISGMAASALDRAHQDAEVSSIFLAELTERLEAIDNYMLSDSNRRRASRESGMRLGRAVSDEVGGLSASMQDGQELPGLHKQVLDALDQIQQHVSTHLNDEAQRSVQAEQQATLMQKQLRALEQETSNLRRQVAETREQAMQDALTGLPNRRALEMRASEELARRRRFAEPLALVVFDVDDFKQINDVFGHKAGDKALALIGRVLKESLRETDFIARYGGEELVVLLPGADRDTALKVADLMRKQVEGAGMHSHNKPVRITLSGGVAVAVDGEDFEQLFERADKAMYQAKQQGKNCCAMSLEG